MLDGQENNYKLNLQALIAAGAMANPDAEKKKEESENKFKAMKAHFDAGVASMTTADNLKVQLKTATGRPEGDSAIAANRRLPVRRLGFQAGRRRRR